MDLTALGCVHDTIRGDAHNILQRVVKTCEEMLQDRGHTTVTVAKNLPASIEHARPIVTGKGGGRVQVSVFLHMEDRVGVKVARSILERTEGNVIIVSAEGATPFTRKECGSRVQFMMTRTLVNNVTKHKLVPKHRRCDALPEGVTMEQMPKMFDTDPIALYYDWPADTIVHIERHFGGNEPIDYFRVVVGGTA